jgi:hypothetical protein
LLGNGSVKIPLSLLGNGSVKIPLSLLGHIPEEDTLQNHRCENLKSYNIRTVGRVVFNVARAVSRKVGD